MRDILVCESKYFLAFWFVKNGYEDETRCCRLVHILYSVSVSFAQLAAT